MLFSTQGWFTPPTFYNMGVWQYRKSPGTRFNRYINITADKWLSISCAMQNQKKFKNLFIIVILTDIIISTWLWLFWYNNMLKVLLLLSTISVWIIHLNGAKNLIDKCLYHPSKRNLTTSNFPLAAWLKLHGFGPVSFTMPYSKLYILAELSPNDVKLISVDRQKLDLSKYITYGTVNLIFVEIQPNSTNIKKWPSYIGTIALSLSKYLCSKNKQHEDSHKFPTWDYLLSGRTNILIYNFLFIWITRDTYFGQNWSRKLKICLFSSFSG